MRKVLCGGFLRSGVFVLACMVSSTLVSLVVAALNISPLLVAAEGGQGEGEEEMNMRKKRKRSDFGMKGHLLNFEIADISSHSRSCGHARVKAGRQFCGR